jgi:alanyl aminopeptidase
VAFIGDLNTLVRSGALPAGAALAALPGLAPASNRHVATQAAALLRNVRHAMVPKELVPSYARLVRRLFGAKARALGFTPKKGDDEDTVELRSTLVPLVAIDGEDPKLQAEARGLADKWLNNRAAVSPDVAGDALKVAAARGDRAFFDRLHAAANKTEDRRDRQRLAVALVAFRDPALLRAALDLLFLSDDFDVREATGLWRGGGTLFSEEGQVLIYDWGKEHFDALTERLPRRAQTILLYLGAGLCDADKAHDYEDSYKDRAEKVLGGPRVVQNVLESIRTCSAIRTLQAPSVAKVLRGS